MEWIYFPIYLKNSIKADTHCYCHLTPQGKEVHSELTLLKDCRTEESFPLHGHMVTFPFPLVSYMCFSRRGILTGMCENIARVSNYTIGHTLLVKQGTLWERNSISTQKCKYWRQVFKTIFSKWSNIITRSKLYYSC